MSVLWFIRLKDVRIWDLVPLAIGNGICGLIIKSSNPKNPSSDKINNKKQKFIEINRNTL